MKKSKFKVLSTILACTLALSSFSVFAAGTDNIITIQSIQHPYLQSFNGYDGIEVTAMGDVGYNYAIKLPNDEVLKFGFNPNNISNNYVADDAYAIAAGWQIKLPFIDAKNKIFAEQNGYLYNISNSFEILNYPEAHTLATPTKSNLEFELSKSYGAEDVYNIGGQLVSSIDPLGKVTSYVYDDTLEKIYYNDGSTIEFVKNDNAIEVVYVTDDHSVTVATFVIEDNQYGVSELKQIIPENGDVISFEYMSDENSVELDSYIVENEYEREIFFDNSSSPKKISSLKTTYFDDNSVITKEYTYAPNGTISKIESDDAEELYEYSVSFSGDLTINTTKTYLNETTVNTKVINNKCQTTKYAYPGTVLTLIYSDDNRIVKEIENGEEYEFTYTPQGKVNSAELPDGEILTYFYDNDGKEISIISSVNGVIKNNVNANLANTMEDEGVIPRSSSASVLYNINNYVGVTNFHTLYGLDQEGFNCYTYSIGKTNDLVNPGYYYGDYSLNETNVTLSKTKLLTEYDQEALGRSIYDSTVSASHNSHAWKIALRVCPYVDYHFMKKSYGTSTAWEFKAGWPGPVMRVLNGYNPTQISWDTYQRSSSTGRYVVQYSGVYTSAINYMIIQD